ncbi:MAG: CBS domain-containing protein [Sedimentisphaerales bacterium]|nr:CBS domain-containing protein [Sedimentisphaerales bacterium]
MLKVEDVMTRDVITVKQDTPIYEAMVIMRKNNITGMPVIDDDMNLVGVITEKDVLRLFGGNEDKNNTTVGSFMTRPAVSYRGDESLQSVCDFMLVNYFRRVPVVSKKGKLIGIISRPDIIDYIIEQRNQNDQTLLKISNAS